MRRFNWPYLRDRIIAGVAIGAVLLLLRLIVQWP